MVANRTGEAPAASLDGHRRLRHLSPFVLAPRGRVNAASGARGRAVRPPWPRTLGSFERDSMDHALRGAGLADALTVAAQWTFEPFTAALCSAAGSLYVGRASCACAGAVPGPGPTGRTTAFFAGWRSWSSPCSRPSMLTPTCSFTVHMAQHLLLTLLAPPLLALGRARSPSRCGVVRPRRGDGSRRSFDRRSPRSSRTRSSAGRSSWASRWSCTPRRCSTWRCARRRGTPSSTACG